MKSLITKNIKSEVSTLAKLIENGEEASQLTSNVTAIVKSMNITPNKIKTESQKIDLKKNAEIKTFADMIGIQFFHFFRDKNKPLKVETWGLKDGKSYSGSKSLSEAISSGVDNLEFSHITSEDNYKIRTDKSVVFDHKSGTNGKDDTYTTSNTKVIIMDLSKKPYTINDILYLAVSEDINDDALRPKDVEFSKLNLTILFQSGDKLIINTMMDRKTGKYHGKSIDFNKGAMERILNTMK